MKKWQEDKVAWQEYGGQVKNFWPQPRICMFMKAWMEGDIIDDEVVMIPKRLHPKHSRIHMLKRRLRKRASQSGRIATVADRKMTRNP